MTDTVERKHVLSIPNEDGDLRVEWDPSSEAQVAEARAAFDRARGNRMAAYRMQPGGGRGELMREFDPNATAILMAPQMVGG